MKLTVEEELTILLSRNTIEPTVKDRIIEIINENNINEVIFYDHIIRNKTVNLVTKNVRDYNLSILKGPWEHVFYSLKESNRLRNEYIYEQVLPIISDLTSKGITCIPLKGIFLNEGIYEDISIRRSNDFDILIKEKDITGVSNYLYDKGFIRKRQITPTYFSVGVWCILYLT